MDFYGTLGTSCRDQQTIFDLFRAGMTGARLNLSHTTLVESGTLLREHFWPAAKQAGVQARLIIDLQGPELRVGSLDAPVRLDEGSQVRLGAADIPIPPEAVRAAEPGCHISLDDSALLLEVQKQEEDTLLCKVLRGGVLERRKSLAVLGREVPSPTLTVDDLSNLDRAAEYGVTHVLQPFVRGREDLEALRRALDARGLNHVHIMAKIENQRGLAHLEEIVENADIICIARGDLGNNMPLWELPSVQKRIARCCRTHHRPFFVVTQMLWSMQQRPVPTRAEVCDIYNAVLDGADALMLTGETAVGAYPVPAMEYLVKTARRAEQDLYR